MGRTNKTRASTHHSALTKGASIIYDTLNDTVHNRDVLRNLAQSANANAVVIYCNTPADIIQQRQHANNQSNERHSVSPSRFLESANRFETPTSKEKYLEYTPNQNVEEWIHKNMISKTTIP